MNIFKSVVSTMLIVFPALAGWGLLVNLITPFIAQHWSSDTSAFVEMLGQMNYFVPLDLVLWIAGFHFVFMGLLLVMKWVLKLIPFIG